MGVLLKKSKVNKLRLNTVSSFLLQIVSIASGLIIPRLILVAYGSEVNGLINSILQFLYIISFMELGVGAVVQSELYKPLAYNDSKAISEILRSTEKFFRTIAAAFVGYSIVLVIVYPNIINNKFDTLFTIALIAAIGLNNIFQYYIGMPERLLLLADQKGYIYYFSQTIILVANTVISVIMIEFGAEIQTVKFVSALVFFLRPLFLRLYVNKHYSIDRNIRYQGEPIKQKWNGLAQHVAAVILDQTDVVILTLFSTLSNVSIYSVYHLVTFGIKNLFLSLMGGIQPLMGEYIARNEKEKLSALFDWTEWLIHTGTTFVFLCAGVLIVPFVEVYTKGVNDANYVVPMFAALIVAANAGHCLRLPYNIMILAAGHYKQTQHNYIIAAIMNVLISALAVRRWGLVGVVVGTLVAMLYQTIWMAYYDSKNILEFPINRFWKHLFVDIIIVIISIVATMPFSMRGIDYVSWIVLAVQKGLICLIITVVTNMVFYNDMMKKLRIVLLKKDERII